MSITQIVEIPANHRIFLDLPLDLPVGEAKITITPQAKKNTENIYGAVEHLRGLAKEMGSTLTVERFLAMRQEDLNLEEEKFQNFFK